MFFSFFPSMFLFVEMGKCCCYLRNVSLRYIKIPFAKVGNILMLVVLLLRLTSLGRICPELLLYADGTCLIFQHKPINKIDWALNKKFSMLCDWFVDNK